MFTESQIKADSKAQFYDELRSQLDHLLEGEPNAIANLSNMASVLGLYIKDINWAGFYLFYPEEQQLILGPFQGKPACIRIPIGKGVCGKAAETGETVLVDDVLSFPGHIACDPASRSEIVIPISIDGNLVGVLDIDSPLPGRFDQEDKTGLEALVAVLIRHSRFTHHRAES